MTLFFALSVSVFSILIALTFFLLTSKVNSAFYSHFRWSWMFYSIGFSGVIIATYSHSMLPLIMKSMFDTLAIIAIFYAICNLFRVQIADVWVKYTVIMFLWVAISTYLQLDPLIIESPLAAYDLAITGYTVLTLMKKYQRRGAYRGLTSGLIGMYGALKVPFAVLPNLYFNLELAFLVEFFYTVMFTVFMGLLYSAILNRELEYRDERFKLMVENSRDSFFHFALIPEPAFEYLSPSILTLTGYEAQDFYMNPRLILNLVTEDHVEVVKNFFWSTEYPEEPQTELVELIAKNGEKKMMEVYVSVVRENGVAVAIDGSVQDVTQREAFQKRLLEEKAAKELMFSYVSHELKTPITSVIGFATALNDGTYQTESDRDRAVEVIIDKAIFAKRMIEDLSQLSRLETNQYSFAYELLTCSELAISIRRATITELEKADLRFVYHLEYDKLSKYSVIADSIRICQVVMNLVKNSIRYTRAKNKVTVECIIDKAKENMIVTVSDRGRGIKAEDIPYIFNRFYKGEHSSTSQGRGLGLAISKEIVEAHNGTISVKSKYGAGTTFTVTIPLYKDI